MRHFAVDAGSAGVILTLCPSSRRRLDVPAASSIYGARGVL